MTDARLPEPLADLFDGERLEDKLGQTFLLTGAEPDGWPRQALLSVGEVLADGVAHLLLALYPGSRTTAALDATRRGLLTVVHEGVVYKLTLALEPLADTGDRLRCFRGSVAAADVDEVGYAEILHGIRFRLHDEEAVLVRWRRQIEDLRGRAST